MRGILGFLVHRYGFVLEKLWHEREEGGLAAGRVLAEGSCPLVRKVTREGTDLPLFLSLFHPSLFDPRYRKTVQAAFLSAATGPRSYPNDFGQRAP